MTSRNQIEIAKATKKSILHDMCNTIDQAKQNNAGRVPFGFVAGLVRSHAAVCPWLSRDALNNEMRRRGKRGSLLMISAHANQITTSVIDLAVAIGDQKKGGRPSGTTDERKKNDELAVIASKNEICLQYDEDRKKKVGKKRLPRGHLTSLISRVKRSNGLGEDVLISSACVRQRYKKARIFLEGSKPGPTSPLHPCEDEFVQVMIQMARMRQALSPSEGVSLINSMILGTQTQKDLIKFKEIHCCNARGTVGVGYWRGFKRRNEHRIV